MSWRYHLPDDWLWENRVGILAWFFLLLKVEIVPNSWKMCVYQIERMYFQATEIPTQKGNFILIELNIPRAVLDWDRTSSRTQARLSGFISRIWFLLNLDSKLRHRAGFLQILTSAVSAPNPCAQWRTCEFMPQDSRIGTKAYSYWTGLYCMLTPKSVTVASQWDTLNGFSHTILKRGLGWRYTFWSC